METNLFNRATEHIKKNQAEKNKKLWCPEFSRFKLQFKYRNGTSSIPYHSYDIHKGKGGINVTDEQLGYTKLLLLIEKQRSQDSFVVASVFANLTDDLRTYVDGKLNMNYDYIVFKIVRHQNPFSHSRVRFVNGKLDVNYMLQEEAKAPEKRIQQSRVEALTEYSDLRALSKEQLIEVVKKMQTAK